MAKEGIIKTNSREFRTHQKDFLDMLDSGKKIILSRGKKNYLLTSINDDELYFTPAMNARIAKSMQQINEGKSTRVKDKTDLKNLLDSL